MKREIKKIYTQYKKETGEITWIYIKEGGYGYFFTVRVYEAKEGKVKTLCPLNEETLLCMTV